MKLSANALLEHIDNNPDPQTDRILWMSVETDELVLIRLDDAKANPRFEVYSALCAAQERGELKLLEVDPFAHLLSVGRDINERHLRIRDRAWEIIEPIAQL